jgi:mannose-6-phosphate isomerase-like protein (cupin superfamily)
MTAPETQPRPSTNPFQASTAEAAHVPAAHHLAAVVREKPWGHELVFAMGTNGYVGKLISVTAGKSLSLQLHRHKDETIHVLSGEVLFESGPDEHDLERTTMLAGDTVHLPPNVVHRITAVTDVRLAEVSTAAPGWEHDVVRLADDYGREGTSNV